MIIQVGDIMIYKQKRGKLPRFVPCIASRSALVTFKKSSFKFETEAVIASRSCRVNPLKGDAKIQIVVHDALCFC